jgi:hypothetical protein
MFPRQGEEMMRDTAKRTWGGQRTLAILCLSLAFVGCANSDDGTSRADAGPPTTGDGSTAGLYPCDKPGQACNAHDPCAIEPICGQDKFCRPTKLQNCDDGLDCTVDTCLGLGQCENKPKPGYCAISSLVNGKSAVRCFAHDERQPDDPCSICEAETSPTKWAQANGGSCDDGNACTKDDYCQSGTCKGTYYGTECSDQLDCTDDVCDGKGGCSNKLKANVCLIGGKCYKSDESDSTGCATCAPQKNAIGWTAVPDVCKIGSLCYASGAKDTTGCGVCDPKLSASSWSASPYTCLVDGLCLQPGAKDVTGCGVCDPQQSGLAYTPLANKCLINDVCYDDGQKSASGCHVCDAASSTIWWTSVSGLSSTTTGFDSGLGGYVADALVNGVGWQLSTARAHSGSGSLYYGHLQHKNYDTPGQGNTGTVTSSALVLPAGKKAALSFWLYFDAENSPNFDQLKLLANGTALWTKSATTLLTKDYRKWIGVELDLSALAGQSVSLSFSFDTVDGWANTAEGVYLDDITVSTGCGASP